MNANAVLVAKPEGRRLLALLKRRWEVNIKVKVKVSL
jgi:hypothetical protein